MKYSSYGPRNNGEPLALIGVILGGAGLIILLVAGIGYPVSKHENDIFELTTGNITSFEALATKHCTWCEAYTCCSSCCSTCGCNDDGCSTCCSTCCSSCCHYISYTCSAAVWGITYDTFESDNCPSPENSTARGDWQTSSGSRATDNSHNKAIQDQKTKPIGSVQNMYYNHNKCKEVKFHISNERAWLDALISGGAIAGAGVLMLCVWGILYASLCGAIGNYCSKCFSLEKSNDNYFQKAKTHNTTTGDGYY